MSEATKVLCIRNPPQGPLSDVWQPIDEAHVRVLRRMARLAPMILVEVDSETTDPQVCGVWGDLIAWNKDIATRDRGPSSPLSVEEAWWLFWLSDVLCELFDVLASLRQRMTRKQEQERASRISALVELGWALQEKASAYQEQPNQE